MRNDRQKQFQKRIVQLTEELVEEYSLNSRIRKALDQCKTEIIQRSRKIPKNNNIVQAMAALVMAKYMLQSGYDVLAEHELPEEREVLRCDLFCHKGDFTKVIEVESGNVPSEYILKNGIEAEDYQEGRIIGKIARYSRFSHNFDLAFTSVPPPPIKLLSPILRYFHMYASRRDANQIPVLLKKANALYFHPVIEKEQISQARLDNVYMVYGRDRRVERIRI